MKRMFALLLALLLLCGCAPEPTPTETVPATTAAPASVTDSVTLMARRFEEASAATDKEALKEEVLEAIAGDASSVISSDAEKSPAKKEEDE